MQSGVATLVVRSGGADGTGPSPEPSTQFDERHEIGPGSAVGGQVLSLPIDDPGRADNEPEGAMHGGALADDEPDVVGTGVVDRLGDLHGLVEYPVRVRGR
jgi:hypothetical protein